MLPPRLFGSTGARTAAADVEQCEGSGLLTPREHELVRELMHGYRVATIARRLHISPHTVRRHLKNIFLKLEVGSQTELLEKLKPWQSEE